MAKKKFERTKHPVPPSMGGSRKLKHEADDVSPDGRYYSSMSEGQYADEMARELGGE